MLAPPPDPSTSRVTATGQRQYRLTPDTPNRGEGDEWREHGGRCSERNFVLIGTCVPRYARLSYRPLSSLVPAINETKRCLFGHLSHFTL